jgi:hypothetical protein
MARSFPMASQGGNTVDSENWFEGWKATGACIGPTLLHPVKGDACGRFSANGYGRGCWKRQEGAEGGAYHDTFVSAAPLSSPDMAKHFAPLGQAELARVL